MIKRFFYFLFLSFATLGWASNELKELEYAEEIESSVSIGKIINLEGKGGSFLSLYTEAETRKTFGAVILLHAMGVHPNQKQIISPLRTYLPSHGWTTLSIQMPVLGVGADISDYYSLFENANLRVQAAVNYLQAEKVKKIVLVGYGLGGTMAVYSLANKAGTEKVKAIVSVSLVVPESNSKIKLLTTMKDIKIPFLDLFAEFDANNVLETVRERRIAGKANVSFQQLEIKGEGHLFQHDEGLVVKRIYSWISRASKLMVDEPKVIEQPLQ